MLSFFSQTVPPPFFLASWAKDGRTLDKYQAAGGEGWDIQCLFPVFSLGIPSVPGRSGAHVFLPFFPSFT